MVRHSPLALVSVLHDDLALQGPHDIELQGDLAYVAGKWGSFAIVDVSDPRRPEVLGAITEGVHNAETVLPCGAYCFLGTNDFLSIDVSDPLHPVVSSQICDPRISDINGMARWGSFILAANKRGFVDLVDASDPTHPTLLDALDTRERGGIESPHDIALAGNHFIIVDQRDGSPLKARTYRFADSAAGDLLPPDQWDVEGSLEGPDLNGANRVVVSGDYAYVVANHAHRLGVIDIHDTHCLTQIANVPAADEQPDGLTIAGNILCIGAAHSVELMDISVPHKPVSIASSRFPELFSGVSPRGRDSAHDLVVRDGLIYVTAQNDNCIGIIESGLLAP